MADATAYRNPDSRAQPSSASSRSSRPIHTVFGSPEVTAVASSTHDIGGCRMGSDPSNSVTNRYGQMWELPNVFVGGGALFPTMAGKNPTQTIWMLSYWAADAIENGKVNLEDSGDYT